MDSERLGESNTGWGVRCYGTHVAGEHFGAVHAGQHMPFYKNWKIYDVIGVRYDTAQRSLTYFVNGRELGTPFTNVEGEIYPCVELCHVGSMTAKFSF